MLCCKRTGDVDSDTTYGMYCLRRQFVTGQIIYLMLIYRYEIIVFRLFNGADSAVHTMFRRKRK
jgi:hypothetical protein